MAREKKFRTAAIADVYGRKSRPARWAAAVSDAQDALARLREVQEDYENWADNLPENLEQSPLGEKLYAVVDLDIEGCIEVIDEAESIDLPRGFGRD